MKSTVKPIPERYHTVTPCLTVPNVAELLAFVKRAFGAEEIAKTAAPDGSIRHAEVRIGDSMVMMGQASEQWKAQPAGLYLYVPDVDAAYQRALAAGGRSIRNVETHFYGDRSGGVEDGQGNSWWLATHVEDVSPAEMERRAAAMR